MAAIAAPAHATDKDLIAERLAEARERTLMLVEPLTEQQLNTVYSELLSPLAWDLGHIANFEELWLVQRVGGRAPLDGELGRFYDAIENPRSSRNELPLLRGETLRAYMADVRSRALEVLAEVELDPDDPLLAGGFVYELLIAHEHQHNETMLQLLQMVDGYPCPGRREPEPGDAAAPRPASVAVEGGTYTVGADAVGFAYDNERPAHEVEVGPFRIDRTPVSNSEFAQFVAEAGAEPPLYWEPDGEGGWLDGSFGRRRPLLDGAPVIHVSWEQARDFARWAGKRLPTEAEWEIAAAGSDPDAANLDQLGYGCRVSRDEPAAASDCGALAMLGDVWEWTASAFGAYPGFEPFPYPEYSEVFFGPDHRVLRGGSWATRRPLIRTSFRNWDYPVRRQIFAGFRCAEDG